MPIACAVAGPTMPSTVSPWARCQRLTAASVCGPNTPSAGTPTTRCTSVTLARPECEVLDVDAVVLDASEVLPLQVPRPSALQVRGPTTPSAVSPLAFWKLLTDAAVSGP